MIKVLHNNNCSKSRAILEYLDENNIQFEIIDLIEAPLSKLELKTVLKKLSLSVHDLTRKEDLLFKENFSYQELSDEALFDVLCENPSLIQRPILIKGSVAMIGRPVENVKFFLQ